MLFSLPCVASMMTVLFLYIAFVRTFGDNTQFIFHCWSYDIDLAMYCYLRDKCCHSLACIVSVIIVSFFKMLIANCAIWLCIWVAWSYSIHLRPTIYMVPVLMTENLLENTEGCSKLLSHSWFLSWWQRTLYKTPKDIIIPFSFMVLVLVTTF